MRWLTVLVAVACGIATAPLTANSALTFTVASHKESPEGLKSSGQPVPNSDESFPLAVTLGHQYLIVEAQGTRTIYDFARQRIMTLNLANKSYSDASLYALLGLRDLEFQNRLMMGALLSTAKAGLTDNFAMQPVFAEQAFSITDTKHEASIDQRQADGETEFVWQDKKLLSISNKTRKLPAGYQSEYWRFLRYYAGGHPKIYAALASVQGVPEKITFVLQGGPQTETREISLNTIRTEADGPYSLDGFAATTPEEAPYSTLKLLGPDAAAQLALRAEATVKDRDAAIGQGQVFDAVLANLAVLLMTGDAAGTTAWTSQHHEALQSDESVRAFAASLSARDQASAQTALQTLAELRKQPGTARYVLDVMQGNTLIYLHQGQNGADHLLSALAVNPYLLGAWHDLGAFYYQSFRPDKAWACWDAARKVNPQHPQFLPIAQIESRIRTNMPDFF
jgi:tetratricopeptide (TPR) repeat protein